MIIKFEGKEPYIKQITIIINYRQGEFLYNELEEIAKELKWIIEKKMCIVNSIEIND